MLKRLETLQILLRKSFQNQGTILICQKKSYSTKKILLTTRVASYALFPQVIDLLTLQDRHNKAVSKQDSVSKAGGTSLLFPNRVAVPAGVSPKD
jgi:hypothetical protein